MTGRRAPVERLVDLAVAIPVSVAVAARQLVPFGVTRLERRIARDLTLLQRYARRGTPASPTAGEPSEAPPARAAHAVSVVPAVPDETVVAAVDADVDVDVDLPIDGYDQLSARQIVDRLPSLTVDELAAVEAHERGRRRRQTVLARIAQLS